MVSLGPWPPCRFARARSSVEQCMLALAHRPSLGSRGRASSLSKRCEQQRRRPLVCRPLKQALTWHHEWCVRCAGPHVTTCIYPHVMRHHLGGLEALAVACGARAGSCGSLTVTAQAPARQSARTLPTVTHENIFGRPATRAQRACRYGAGSPVGNVSRANERATQPRRRPFGSLQPKSWGIQHDSVVSHPLGCCVLCTRTSVPAARLSTCTCIATAAATCRTLAHSGRVQDAWTSTATHARARIARRH